jgi:hypothetical protein
MISAMSRPLDFCTHPDNAESGHGQSAFAASDAAKPKVARMQDGAKSGANRVAKAADRDGGVR